MKSVTTLIFDGDCGFCLRWVNWIRPKVGSQVRVEPFQKVLPEFPQVSEGQCRNSIQWMRSDGSVARGAEAFFEALATGPFSQWLTLYRAFVPFRLLSEWGYRWVATHRVMANKVLEWLWGPSMPFSVRYERLLSTLARGMGVVYAMAFVSLAVQSEGLWGPNGVLPARDYLGWLRETVGPSVVALWPTLFWIQTSLFFQKVVLGVGGIAALFLILNRAPKWTALTAWIAYLSWVNVGQVFLEYQWDMLLLESGLVLFVALCLGPGRPALFLFRLLFFKFIFQSGLAKIESGDPTWRSLTALQYHFETTPLPTTLSSFAHHAPVWFLKITTATTLFLECVTPFFFFCARNVRAGIFVLHLLLQIGIGVTGQYGFFNILAIVLSLSLLEDSLPPFSQADWRIRSRRMSTKAIVITTIWPFLSFLPLPQLEGWHLSSHYGLFASMTTSREELRIERKTLSGWEPYEFRWKPGKIDRAPRWVQPHMPRLDWQMWFASLGRCENQRWLHQLLFRLLEGRPEVLALFREPPPTLPAPTKLRVVRVPYHFSSPEGRLHGIWWNAGEATPYCPEVSF
ncbi:MAG: lipase maturation factor family protein [Deltaproteobacteria bacterium]|nr:lipase maturation factor family protein [Deltaproteobacteria bacterium]MBI3293901.1 lipase maturation factor family protein [Deltaproteobacteria bacterium]